MDFKKIKDTVIREQWGDEGRYGDDYRNLSKQVDNFLSYLKKENSPRPNWSRQSLSYSLSRGTPMFTAGTYTGSMKIFCFWTICAHF